MSAVLIAACLAMTFIGTRTTYWIFKVMAGFFWWALAFYWNQLPVSTDASLRTILVLVPIFIGLSCMFWGFWFSRTVNGEVVSKFKLPFTKEDEDTDEVASPTHAERVNNYRARLNRRINGR